MRWLNCSRPRRDISGEFWPRAKCSSWAIPPRNCIANAAACRSLKDIDWIFGVRGNGAEFVRAAIEAGHPEERTQFFENSDEAAKFLSGFIERGDLLLLKGSRGVRMEKILEAIDAGHRAAGNQAGRNGSGAQGEGLKCSTTFSSMRCDRISAR